MKPTRRDFLLGASTLSLLPGLPRLVLANVDEGLFELTAAPQELSLVSDDGPLSPLWTYNGGLPGPEIRIKRGERIRVNFSNQLEEPTSVHWHGIRIENSMDGVAGLTQQPVMLERALPTISLRPMLEPIGTMRTTAAGTKWLVASMGH